ncbi:hypothetical protein [Massilia sp. ZL223]|uniref:hypothetical protein n=1 Tax=Massilia sp. ZL223 TaxID=2824904 RepID=UPI001B824DDF|nr:hypothetical protein [Massilia sp. ZL223]MBQ5964348.1 hypothetical protein [Massilia sp. ZL223]
MTDSGEAQRLERAQRLRKQIEDLTRPKRRDTAVTENESPAEFIHRRMQEIDKDKKGRPE